MPYFKPFDASTHFDSPVGVISLYSRGDAVVFIEMGGDPAPDSGKAAVLKTARQQLERYFAGKSKVLDFKVSLDGTEFQKAVWQQIASIPFGQTMTYVDIARAIGKPLASRAVGGAVGSNPVPLVVGCHRVLGSGGKITGYSGGDGLPTKRKLLALEGITAKE